MSMYPNQPQAVMPYATPQQFQGPPQGMWQDSAHLVVTSLCRLPDRCIKCNQPANGYRLRKTVYWHEPWIWVTILAGVLVYAILAMVMRKKVTLEAGLCPVHRKQRSTWGWIIGGICLLSVPMFVGSGFLLTERSTEGFGALMIVLGIVTLLTAAIVAAVGLRLVKPVKIDERYGWLTGVSPEFLATLPPVR